jgi:hypothetical protein
LDNLDNVCILQHVKSCPYRIIFVSPGYDSKFSKISINILTQTNKCKFIGELELMKNELGDDSIIGIAPCDYGDFSQKSNCVKYQTNYIKVVGPVPHGKI